MTESLPSVAVTGDSLGARVAVITGAARGIGYEIAKTFASEGATVIVSDVDEAAAVAAAASLPGASAQHCDVRDEASVEALFSHAVEHYGRVDVAVANAGIVNLSPLAEMPFDQWGQLMSINLDGVFLTVKHAARAMIATQTQGSIVTMSSVTAKSGIPLAGHYAATKAAVLNLTKTAALELRPAGIRVNAILPGFAQTELLTANTGAFEAVLGVDFDALIEATQGGYVTVADVAGVALFLAADRSSFTTGAGYTVDNALTASLI